MRAALLRAMVLMACMAPASASWAALGGDVRSVLRDHARLGAADVVTQGAGYELHEALTADGVHLRQYVNLATGTVFAATWQGPRLPQLTELLGQFAPRYTAAAAAHRGGHHVLTIAEPGFAVTVLRLQRGWMGQALLPASVPAGMDRHDIR